MKFQTTFILLCLTMLVVAGCQDAGTKAAPETPEISADSESPDPTFEQDDSSDDDSSDGETVPAGTDTPELTLPLMEDILAPGSSAPSIDLAAVVHGPEVRPFAGDHVVVVEFWATWCGPCIRNMPHLSSLQQQYGKEVQFIGVTDEDEDSVTQFLERELAEGETWGEALQYTLALDNDQNTAVRFMLAARQNGIPCAFVIDRSGKIAWIGHPAAIDEPLAAIVSGEWDLESAKSEFLGTLVQSEPPAPPEPVMPTLGPGTAAPEPQLAGVVHGAPFDGTFTEGKTYVVEFWATWCGPCIASMPHMSQLQQQYGDSVQFIGITGEDEQTVTDFLAQEKGGNTWAEILKYSIALDDDRSTNTNYMVAAAQDGIPCAFIVNQEGNVAWVGHPMQIDEPLAQVVDGTFDIEQAATMFFGEHELRAAIDRGDLEQALDQLSELTQGQADNLKLQLLELQLLSQLDRKAEYSEAAGRIAEHHSENFNLLNGLAWEIAAIQKGDGRDLALAMHIAMKASEGTDHKNPSVLDTVARVHFEQGDLLKAVEWQKKAVQATVYPGGSDVSPMRSRIAPQLKQTLNMYLEMLPEDQREALEASDSEEAASDAATDGDQPEEATEEITDTGEDAE